MANNPFHNKNKNVFQSFEKAYAGFLFIAKHHKHFRTELLLALCAIFLGFELTLSRGEWLALILAINIGLISEIFNTGIEEICNLITRDHHISIKIIKDVAGSAVFLSALFSYIIGLIIFIPKVIALIK
ncbi:MAG: putative Diacylglycerol kinase [Parcubacteria group bacterium GW2011_GWC1_41_7]|nr:MAG: putative Diacylglycerol kinase [Parcubacteria group bacterium GW2011_GWC1_41_7]